MDAVLNQPNGIQNIRCLPAKAGSAVVFSHRIIHWGSKSTLGYQTPRIAVAFALADPEFEVPLPALALVDIRAALLSFFATSMYSMPGAVFFH